jgi:hypothetical protein
MLEQEFKMAERKATDLIYAVTLDSLRALLQESGFRVETVTSGTAKNVFLRSATGGMAFDVRPGNLLGGEAGRFADFSFLALLAIKGGDLPSNLVNNWNNQRRFGRLHVDQGFLMLDMDVSVAGGVAADHLRAQTVVWDQLLQGLIAYLRTELPRLAAAAVLASGDVPAPAVL